ncbi:chaC-like protein domain-containing protein [Ditylenchus destructor]|uniref:glutathione-specific gamma-glutamylcyclotransferase n=1 Tax=Ditylenchus destructor TaxID=166010 RepID=A0AAD4NA13_9BILA|nr:chaC-like protein domain-containing protein [Ditylenchus destructor]
MSQEPPLKRPVIEDFGNNTVSGNIIKGEQRGETENEVIAVTPYREPFDSTHRLIRAAGKFHLLLAVTGSVAAIKVQELIAELYRLAPRDKLVIKVVTTLAAKNFFEPKDIQEIVYEDHDEWNMWKKRGDPVLHIELRKWADLLLIAPLDANTLAKTAHGICDNLVSSVIRAWDQEKPLYFAPAMNTCMWNNPLTYQQLKTLKELLLFKEIPPIEKELMCGDKGYGAMASLQMIASIVASEIKNKFAGHSRLISAAFLNSNVYFLLAATNFKCSIMWVFGYGSLLWYQDFPYVDAVPGVVTDYVRRFWQLSPDHRGTPERPGRTVTLVPQTGGTCWGMAFKIPDYAVESSLAYLNFRERAGYRMETVKFYPDNGSEPFDLNVYISIEEEQNIYNAGPTAEEEIVKTIITSRGKSGSNLEYALRLADCQRRLAPHHSDDHLFEIETRLLEACERTRIKDEILRKLNYKLSYLIDRIEHEAESLVKEKVK